ncbi:MAG TPA: DUF4401 domain-containing protein [Candidatus Methylacidiphilales bacterium]|nr:DUF4401 domain-containing protein [Candidatus Methylacidiphilales bacterium]
MTHEQRVSLVAHTTQPAERLPWYLYGLVAMGAWISCFFFLGFIGAFFGWLIYDNIFLLMMFGIPLVGTATLASRLKLGVFVDQVALAFSVTGHILILCAIGQFAYVYIGHGTEFGAVALASLALAGGLYFVYTDYLHRFLSFINAYTLIWIWLVQDQVRIFSKPPPVSLSTLLLGDLIIGIQLLLLGWIFLRPSAPRHWRPLGYATAVALLAQEVMTRFISMVGLRMMYGLHGSHLFYSLALIGLLIWLAGPPWFRRRTHGEFGLLFAALALGAIGTPTTLLALAFLVGGFALQDRFFMISGSLSLGYFLFMYYYDINVDLATKSGILLSVGIVILLARYFLQLSLWKGSTS